MIVQLHFKRESRKDVCTLRYTEAILTSTFSLASINKCLTLIQRINESEKFLQMEKIKFILIIAVIIVSLTSCTEQDEQIQNKTEIQATGGEVDDPVEPDRD